MTLSHAWIVVFVSCAFWTGCLQDTCERVEQFVRYDPVYLTEDGMRIEPRASCKPREIFTTTMVSC